MSRSCCGRLHLCCSFGLCGFGHWAVAVAVFVVLSLAVVDVCCFGAGGFSRVVCFGFGFGCLGGWRGGGC